MLTVLRLARPISQTSLIVRRCYVAMSDGSKNSSVKPESKNHVYRPRRPNERENIGQNIDECEMDLVKKQISPAFYTGNAPYYDLLYKLRSRIRDEDGSLGGNCEGFLNFLREDPTEAVRLANIFISRDNMASQDLLQLYPHQYDTLVELMSVLYLAGGNEFDPLLIPFIKKSVIATSERKIDEIRPDGSSFAVGHRKTAIARVFVIPGTGEFKINGIDLGYFFSHRNFAENAIFPLQLIQNYEKYNIWSLVHGGGETGKAGAIAHGLAQALVIQEPSLSAIMEKNNQLEKDPRLLERKKPGMLKSRRKYSWAKR